MFNIMRKVEGQEPTVYMTTNDAPYERTEYYQSGDNSAVYYVEPVARLSEAEALAQEVKFDGNFYLTPYWEAFARPDGSVRVHTSTQYGKTTDTVFDSKDEYHAWHRRFYGMMGDPEKNRK